MLRYALFAALLILAARPAVAATEQLYAGAAGPAQIVMGLTQDGTEVDGRYFYRTSRLDIALTGQWRGARLQLASDVTGDHLDLTRSGPDLTGSLTTAKGRKLAVSLSPAVAPAGLPADIPPTLGAYERQQLAGLTLIPDKTAQPANGAAPGKSIRWYREPVTGIRLFRIESGYPPAAIAALNHALANNQWSEVSAWLACTGPDGKPGMDHSAAGKPWLGPGAVSYLWSSGWYCAGAVHPDFATSGQSFDAATGRELTLDEVLPVGRAPVPAADTPAWYDYRGKLFAPAAIALLKRYHPKEMAAPKAGPKADDEAACDYTDLDVWQFPTWALTEKGLWLGAVFPRAARPCDAPDWAVIPWQALPTHARFGM